jgi:hypothetical protein
MVRRFIVVLLYSRKLLPSEGNGKCDPRHTSAFLALDHIFYG